VNSTTRHALATAAGLLAAGVAFLAADRAVGSWRAGLVAALNFVVYAGFVVQYVPTYRHHESAFGSPPDDAAIGLFVFGLTMWMLAIGSAVVIEWVSRERADAEGSPMAAVGD
jgi:hypothetical protein